MTGKERKAKESFKRALSHFLLQFKLMRAPNSFFFSVSATFNRFVTVEVYRVLIVCYKVCFLALTEISRSLNGVSTT